MAEFDDIGNLTLNVGPPVDTAELVPGADNGEVNLVPIPLTPDDMATWKSHIDKAKARVDQRADAWKACLEEYMPVVAKKGESQEVKVSVHFRNVHTKIGQLFYQMPDLVLTPKGPMAAPIIDPVTGMQFTNDDVVQIKREVLNDKLGDDGVDVSQLVDEVLFDILGWAGIGCTKIGYRASTKPVTEPVMVPDPNFVPPVQPGSVLGLGPTPVPPMVPQIDPATGQPVTRTVQVPIHEDWYWSRFSPLKLLVAAELTSGRFDKESPWIGMRFEMIEHQARRVFNIAADTPISTNSSPDDSHYQHSEDAGAKPDRMVTGVCVYYKAALMPTSDEINSGNIEVHPEAIRELVLIDGMTDRPAVHRPSPDQTFDRLGRLTADSMVGFPIHVLTTRDLADSPFPGSDVAFTQSEVRHINTHRRQSVQLRDRNIGKYLYDSSAFSPDEVHRLKHGEVGEYIPVEAGKLREGSDKIIAPVMKAEPARDDFRLAQLLEKDVEKTLGLGGPQVGSAEEGNPTATEIATIESKSNERIGKERNRVIKWYLRGVRKFDALLQRYCDDADYVEIVGSDGARKMQQWDKTLIAGRYAYKAKPDSQLKLDAAQDRAQALKYLEVMIPNIAIVGPEPVMEGLKRVAELFGYDSSKFKPPLPPLMSSDPGAGAAPVDVGTGRLPNAPNPGAGTPEVGNIRNGGRGGY